MAWWWPKFQVETSCHINNTVIPNHKMIYYSYFHSVMTYGLLFWGLSSDSMKIFILQKKIIRIIMGCRSSDSCRKLLFNPLNTTLNPICHLLALLGAYHFLHVSRIRVNIEILPLCSKCIFSLLLFMIRGINFWSILRYITLTLGNMLIFTRLLWIGLKGV
jgi:hypothetical protein